MSEVSMVSTSTTQPDDEEEENRRVSFIVCCNLVLFIIMIILLLLVFMRYTSSMESSEESDSPTYKRIVGGGGGPPTTTPIKVTATVSTTTPTTTSSTTSTTATPTTTVTPATPVPTTTPPPTTPTVTTTTRSTTTKTTTKSTTPTTTTPIKVTATVSSTTPTTTSSTTPTTATPTTTVTPATPAPTTPPPPTTPAVTTTTRSTTTKTTTTSTTPTTTTPVPKVRNYTLICVFEALRQRQWNVSYSCTDYVYIRFFSYSNDPQPGMKVIFEKKKQLLGVQQLYYDNSDKEWRQYSYRALDTRVRSAKARHPGSRWYLGIWGSTYIRLMNALFDAPVVYRALYDVIRSNFSERLNTSFFNGFGIINTIICDSRPLGRAKPYSTMFRGTTYGPPILDPSWLFIHTAAIFPLGSGRIPETMVADILREADIVGLSTSNTTDEPNILQDRIQNNAPYLYASPPNPIMPPGPGTRGMLDALKDFPHWKQVLQRNRLCFSVTTSINYAYTSVDGIDFVQPLRNPPDVQRYSRRRFVDSNSTTKLPVLQKYDMVHFYDNVTHTHYWRYQPPGQQLLSFFAYDNADTIKYKVEQMLKAYPDDRCVVFDDLGEDGLDASFTVKGVKYEWKSYAMFEAVYDVLNRIPPP